MMLELLQITSPVKTKIDNPVNGEVYLGRINLQKVLVNTNTVEFVLGHRAWHMTDDQERIEFIEVWFISNTCMYFKMSYDEFKRITYEGTIIDNR